MPPTNTKSQGRFFPDEANGSVEPDSGRAQL